MKYYITYYIKNEPKDSKTFNSYEEGMAFKNRLLEDPDLECISRVKLIK
tara:strand:+ start:249 stop:395 length:147 start_codon:yes stop_codon:yes gene_type:complete